MYVKSVLKALAPHITTDHLIISIAAGVRIQSIEELLPSGSKVVRSSSYLPQSDSAIVVANI